MKKKFLLPLVFCSTVIAATILTNTPTESKGNASYFLPEDNIAIAEGDGDPWACKFRPGWICITGIYQAMNAYYSG